MPCMCEHVLQRCVCVIFSAANQCSLYFLKCYGNSQQTTVTPDHLALKPQHPHWIMCRSNPNFSLFMCMCMCMCGMDVSWQKPHNNNFNSTQTISSPIQVTQPSSTQESFAKSNGPALFFSLYCFLSFSSSLLHFLARLAPKFSLPSQSKDGRWLSEASWMDGEFTLGKLGWRDTSLL